MFTLILCIFREFMILHKFILYHVISESFYKSYDNYFYVIINKIIY